MVRQRLGCNHRSANLPTDKRAEVAMTPFHAVGKWKEFDSPWKKLKITEPLYHVSKLMIYDSTVRSLSCLAFWISHVGGRLLSLVIKR